MKKNDSDGALVGLIVALVIIALIVYVIVIAATFIIGAGVVAGTGYGGYKAIRNYCSSFNENMIQSNKKPKAA